MSTQRIRTIKQMRQRSAEGIGSMRKAVDQLTDKNENAREVVTLLNEAERWRVRALCSKRLERVQHYYSRFTAVEKDFWKILKGGAE